MILMAQTRHEIDTGLSTKFGRRPTNFSGQFSCLAYIYMTCPYVKLHSTSKISISAITITNTMISILSCHLLIFTLLILPPFVVPVSFDYPTAKPDNITIREPISFSDGSTIRVILLLGVSGPSFACGFFCTGACKSNILFAVYIVYTDSGSYITDDMGGIPQVVWSANRDRPVSENATVRFSSDGNLILQDGNGTTVWSTNTAGKSVAGVRVTETGNLVLFDDNNATVWDSFDYPTDSWVLGQTLKYGLRLTANVSETNWTSGQLYLTVDSQGLSTYVDANPPQLYSIKIVSGIRSGAYVTFTNGSLNVFLAKQSQPNLTISLPPASTMQYIRLESDGHLRLYDWQAGDKLNWKQASDILDYRGTPLGVCDYPTVCGQYGYCSNGQCSCLNSTYFAQVDDRQVSLGCSPVTPLSCNSTRNHRILVQDDVTYFGYYYNNAFGFNTDGEGCQQACLRNCSCAAAFFLYTSNKSAGACYLQSKVFSMKGQRYNGYNSTAFIKVQDPSATSSPLPDPNIGKDLPKKAMSSGVIAGVIIGALFVTFFIFGFILVIMRRRRRRSRELAEEDQFDDQLAGLPTRFSYEELRVATEDFAHKLGEGGFGCVFRGTMSDGAQIAVKRLEGVGQGKREFLAEVKSIGNIHHINLIRLVGFCTEKSHRLLVYEFMHNGSLDKWIFQGNQNASLDWKMRVQIMTDVAKGLAYLHEECRQRIAHLDIKPPNILLDEEFHAKVADFGLARLIDREQSHVLTTLRGTRGYLAPEWLTSRITEMVDVFSFGVVVIETVCGRKNLDHSLQEESVHLVSLLQDKANQNRLLDIVDRSGDMQLYESEVLRMMRLAMWCLQIESTKRPKMSTVVKVLEGSEEVETNIEYNFVALTQEAQVIANNLIASAPQLPWLLSGPR